MRTGSSDDNLKTVREYHERTKHHLNRYARSLGFMDWANQPNPFRRYEGAPLRRLALPRVQEEPAYDSLFTQLPAPAPVTADSISELFYYSLALSAWKQVTRPDGQVQSRWSLRVDPSSGNLHPTEGCLIASAIRGICDTPAVYHYAPFEHGLELRRRLDQPLAGGALLVGLTSIHWREAWKYGERAFRYCQHDVGHAIGALTLSAACLGWHVRLLDGIATETLSTLLGVEMQEGDEAEHADCLLLLSPEASAAPPEVRPGGGDWLGTPNELSRSHHPWPVIEEVSKATRSGGLRHEARPGTAGCWCLSDGALPAHQIIRQRRSAQAMDGETSIGRDTFYRMLQRLVPAANPMPFATLPWRPAVSLVLFVHRVEGIEPGLYALLRDPAHETALRDAFQSKFEWKQPGGCPDGLALYRLTAGNAKEAAKTVCCHQDIASDGVFAAGMLAEFDARLAESGPAMYPRLFWETGLIGQVLYLEAEAAGIRGTGIGCFFDDAMHNILGIEDQSWQSLYHFTVGGPLDDPRLQTVDAYEHLKNRELHGADAWREA